MKLLFILYGMRSKYIGHIICYNMVHKGSNAKFVQNFAFVTPSPPPAIFLRFQALQRYIISDFFLWKMVLLFGHLLLHY